MLDELPQMDGMEWLIVICVGLDAPMQEGDAGSAIGIAEIRSMLYRGVTRAHMMVMVVNVEDQGAMLVLEYLAVE